MKEIPDPRSPSLVSDLAVSPRVCWSATATISSLGGYPRRSKLVHLSATRDRQAGALEMIGARGYRADLAIFRHP